MKITVRLASKNDMPEVHSLIVELAHFEKEPDAVEVTIEDLERDGFGANPEFVCFVAEIDGKIGGMALVYKRYSTWKGVALHLEDLIVNMDNRGLGIGTQLLDTVVKYGHDLGVKRIVWEVLDWNKPAIDFYLKKGGTLMTDWRVVHLDENGIKNYLSKL